MKYRDRFFLYALVLGLTDLQAAHGEHARAPIDETPAARPTSTTKLDGNFVQWMSQAFGVSFDYIEKGFAKLLPQAVELSIQQKQYGAVGGAMAQLFRLVHEGQIKQIAEALPKPPCGEPQPNAARHPTMLADFYYAAEDILRSIGEPIAASCESAAKTLFLDAFRPQWSTALDTNKEFHRLLALAPNNHVARGELMTKFGEHLTKFIETQATSGNRALATMVSAKLGLTTPERPGGGQQPQGRPQPQVQPPRPPQSPGDPHREPPPPNPGSPSRPIDPSAIFLRACASCHGPESGQEFLVDNAGKVIGGTAAQIRLRVSELRDMPNPPKTLTNEERDLIKAWADAQ